MKKLIIFLTFFILTSPVFAESPKIDASPQMQEKRRQFIGKLIDQKIIMKVKQEEGTYPRIHVDRGFYELSFDQKETLMNAVLSYYYAQNPKLKTAILKDGYTGKDIGDFSIQRGLKLK